MISIVVEMWFCDSVTVFFEVPLFSRFFLDILYN